MAAAALLLLLSGTTLPVQEPWPVPRLMGPVELDGRSDEAAWQMVPSLGFTMLQPAAGGPPSDPAELRLAYDERYLYAAGRFQVADPAEIRAGSLTRDRLGADDVFRLLLDTYDDEANAVVFATTPAGIQVDYSIGDDGVTVNESWNSFWDVAVARDRIGWYAELRIPLSSLRFAAGDSGARMGLIASRFSARRNELATIPALSPRHANAERRPSLARTLWFAELRSRAPLYLSPYALAGGNRTAGPAPGLAHDRSTTLELGGDLKYGLGTGFTLDLTANTDFAQVEADDEQVNLSRFSLFFPEKRQFFQERAALFAVATGRFLDGSLFFHSRRVGLADGGRPLRIYGGGRLVGRAGGWDLGLLEAQVESAEGGGSENLGVARVRRRLLNRESAVGAIVTTRMSGARPDNVAYALDARLRVLADDYLTAQWGHALTEDAASAPARAGMARVSWERPGTFTSQGLAYVAGVKWSGPGFDPSLGFQPRRDFTHVFLNARYGVYPSGGWVRVVQPSAVASEYRRNRDGAVESRFAALFLNYELTSGVNGWLGWNHSAERLVAPLALDAEVAIPAGSHRFDSFEAVVQPPLGSELRLGASLEAGSFYDGTRVTLGLSPSWTVSPHLEVELSWSANRIRFPDRGVRFDTDLLRLRLQAALDTRFSAGGFVQYNSAADLAIGNLRLRYRFGEGRDLYLVYNERLNTERETGAEAAPLLPLSQERTVLLKYTHTFAR